MKLPLGPRDAERLSRMSPEELHAFLIKCGPAGILALDAQFEMWAANGQIPPASEGWRVWLMMAGRGFGKTRAGAEWVDSVASSRRGLRIALVGATIAEARAVMVEGVSGILAVAARKGRRVRWEPSLGRLRWPNGSEAHLFSGDNPDGLRGPEHDVAWCAAMSRCHCRGRGRGSAARRPARVTSGGVLLYRCGLAHRRMGGSCT